LLGLRIDYEILSGRFSMSDNSRGTASPLALLSALATLLCAFPAAAQSPVVCLPCYAQTFGGWVYCGIIPTDGQGGAIQDCSLDFGSPGRPFCADPTLVDENGRYVEYDGTCVEAPFRNCSAAHEQAAREAINRALQLIDRPKSDTTFLRLFGPNANRAQISQIQSAIKQTLMSTLANNQYQCVLAHCAENIAYLQGTAKPPVNLCDTSFFDAPVEASPSINPNTRVTALIHEAAHIVLGETHFAQGYEQSMELAKTAPDQALRNPDNHAYFNVDPF
jgi:hypothetical protein